MSRHGSSSVLRRRGAPVALLTLLAGTFFLGQALSAPLVGTGPVDHTETNVVSDCNAVPDGVTDNWSVLQSCITLAARTGRSLYFPPGTYNVAGTLNLVDDAFRIRGANRETTQIVETLPSADLFLAKAPNGNPLNQLTLSSLRLSYASTSATGTALRCENCWRTFVQDMNFGTVDSRTSMGGTGISAVGGNQLHVLSSNFSAPVTRAIYAAKIGDLYLQDLEINLSESSSQLGVVLDTNVGGIYATNVNVTAGKTGFLFQQTLGGPPPNYGFFTNCLADTQNGPGGVGWDFESAQSMVLTNSWAASATTTGILANGVDGLTIDGGRVYNNGGIGIDIGPGAKNVSVQDSRIAGNSRLATPAVPAIRLRAGADDVQIQNNRIGAQDSFANTQSYAVTIQNGYGDTLQVTGNHLLNNLQGDIDNQATIGARWVMRSNVGGGLPASSTSLALASLPSGQRTDQLPVSARLTDAAGTPVVGVPVELAISSGARSTVVTDATGAATTSFPLTLEPGSYTVSARYAGTAAQRASQAEQPLTVLAEDTRTSLTVAGAGSKRAATATVADWDSTTGVGGVTVALFGDGIRLATAVTDAAGRATFGPGVAPASSYRVQFAGDSRWNSSSATS